ncbi:hypothetical protein TNCV_3939431 [Trichonephila clavipes]|nr:hypothetical protein TNCV_3939431 [Trichonephila clavipes]
MNCTRAFGDGPREPWSSETPELAPPPNYHTTPTGGHFSSRRFRHRYTAGQWYWARTQSQPRSDAYTTRLPRPSQLGEVHLLWHNQRRPHEEQAGQKVKDEQEVQHQQELVYTSEML